MPKGVKGFQKGESNRKGKHIIPEIVEIKKHSREDWIKALHKCAQYTQSQAESIFKDPGTASLLELQALSLMTQGISGNVRAAEFWVSWVAGKVPDIVEHRNKTKEEVIKLLGTQLLEMAKDVPKPD